MDVFIIVFYINLFLVYLALSMMIYIIFYSAIENKSAPKIKKKMTKPPGFITQEKELIIDDIDK